MHKKRGNKVIRFIVTVLLVISSNNLWSDPDFDCEADYESLNEMDKRYCNVAALSNPMSEYENKLSNLKLSLEAHKEDLRKIGSGYDYLEIIGKIQESHELWLRASRIDCDLSASSPRNYGSRNPDALGCLSYKYEERIKQIDHLNHYWIEAIKLHK